MKKFSFVLVLLLQYLASCLAGDLTCSLSQHCLRSDPKIPFCPDSKKVENPVISFFEPAKVKNTVGLSDVCPFMNVTEPMCCNDDQVLIMTNAFKQIDSVFGADVSMCGVNLKKLWCSFSCDPQQTNFVQGVGYQQIDMGGEVKNLTEIKFMVDEDMACTIFKSCQKTSLIAQASLQSSKSFLDFMGVNGQNQSLSIITFEFDNKTENSHQVRGPMKKCGLDGQVKVQFEQKRLLQESNSDDTDKNMSQPLNVQVHPCGMKIPANGTVDGYPKLEQAQCTFCDEMCQAPDIDASIKFFDGFDTRTVAITYFIMGILTLAWQIYLYLFRKKDIAKEYEVIVNQHQDFGERSQSNNSSKNVDNINQTASKDAINPFKLK